MEPFDAFFHKLIGFFWMPKPHFSVAIPEAVDERLQSFLLRADEQEDLTFALWTPSKGRKRTTGLLHTIILPGENDRLVHGNVAFTKEYLDRACNEAMGQGCGIALLHSHLGPGWQGMSNDDITAETQIAGAVESLTGFPLVGLTLGTDGTWSARFWEHVKGRKFKRRWCRSVRTVGSRLRVSFADKLAPRPKFQEMFKRTVSVWGEKDHASCRPGFGLGSWAWEALVLLWRRALPGWASNFSHSSTLMKFRSTTWTAW